MCDKVTILRDGKLIRTSAIKNENKEMLVEAMLGQPATITFPKKEFSSIEDHKTIFEIDKLKTDTGLMNVSLKVNYGEIVGLLGLVGSGRTETLRAIFGADKILHGKMKYLEKNLKIKNPNDAIKKGIVMIPEDRRKLGLVFTQNTKSNISITNLNKISNLEILNGLKEKTIVQKLINQVDIKPNVIDGNIIRYLNLESDFLRKYSIKSIKADDPVWFGCDVGKFFSKEFGVMDLDLFNFDTFFGTDFPMSKSERLEYGDSVMTHAMVFTGVDIKNRKPVKWRVENSWGADHGKKGYDIMSDSWFDEFMYEVVIHKKHLPAKIVKQYQSKLFLLQLMLD